MATGLSPSRHRRRFGQRRRSGRQIQVTAGQGTVEEERDAQEVDGVADPRGGAVAEALVDNAPALLGVESVQAQLLPARLGVEASVVAVGDRKDAVVVIKTPDESVEVKPGDSVTYDSGNAGSAKPK